MGYQISSYLTWQYLKNKRKLVGLNKLFLAFVMLIGISVTSLVLRVLDSFYIQYQNLADFMGTLVAFIILISFITFLLMLSSKEFSEVFNIFLTRLISLLLLGVSIIMLLMSSTFLSKISFIILLLIGFSYLFGIQVKFLRLSTSDVTKRFRKILIGELFLGIGIISEEIIPLFQISIDNIYSLVFIIIALLGLIIFSLGIYRFPAFLEFGWRDNLLKVIIVDQRNLTMLYTYDFAKENPQAETTTSPLSVQDKEVIFSKGIIGVETILNSIKKGQKTKLEKIEHENFIILLTYGEEPYSFLTYALLVKKSVKSLEYILKVIKDQFQGFYKEILLHLDYFEGNEGKVKVLLGFDTIISNLIK